METVTKFFTLQTNEDHRIEFQNGLDNFIFVFKWNHMVDKWALSVYKNYELKLQSYYLAWSLEDLFSPFKYLNLGSFKCTTTNKEIQKDGKLEYSDINKNNILNVIFRWDYDLED